MPEITDPGLLQQLNAGATQQPRVQRPLPSPPKPVDPYKDEDQAFQRNAEARAAEAARRQAEKDRRDQMEWDATHFPDGTPKPNANSPMSATQLEIEAKKEGADRRAMTVRQLMGQVRGLYESNIKGQPIERGFGALEYVDMLPNNEEFTKKAAAILPLIRPLVAQTAKEGDSDKEMQVFMAYIPTADDSDRAIEGKLNSLEILIGGMVDGKLPSETQAELQSSQADQQGNISVGGKAYQPVQGPPPSGPGYGQDFLGGVGDVVQGAGDVLGLVANPANAAVNAAFGTNLTTDFGQYLRD